MSQCRVCGRRFLFGWAFINLQTNRTVCSWRCLSDEVEETFR